MTLLAEATEFNRNMRLLTVAMNAAASRIKHAGRELTRNLWRSTLTPGERHIDRIAKDCIARRLDVAATEVRLIAAADFAAVLDGRKWTA